MRLLSARGELLDAQLLRARVNLGCHHTAGGDELHTIGARGDLFANRFADVIRSVSLPADSRCVTAGHAHHQVGRDHPQTFNQSTSLRFAHGWIGAIAACLPRASTPLHTPRAPR